jgi:hypothetical protein
MPMGADKNKTEQCPQKERAPEDHTPPRLRTEERSSRFRAIQNYIPLDSTCSDHFFLRLKLHVSPKQDSRRGEDSCLFRCEH